MTARPRPRLVEPSADPPIDIGALIRADIQARDWDAVMVWGDKQKPVELGERRKGWR